MKKLKKAKKKLKQRIPNKRKIVLLIDEAVSQGTKLTHPALDVSAHRRMRDPYFMIKDWIPAFHRPPKASASAEATLRKVLPTAQRENEVMDSRLHGNDEYFHF